MYIYNVTTQISWTIHTEWLQWMKETRIPEVVATGCFTHHRLVKVLEVDESEGPTYAVQYFVESWEIYKSYLEKHAPGLRKDAIERWGNAFISFHSVMEVVH
jgi:hypothetical protein